MATFSTTKEKLVNAWNGAANPAAPPGVTVGAPNTSTGSPNAPATPSWLDEALKFVQVDPNGTYQKDGMYYQPIYGNQPGGGENYDRGEITEWNVYGTDKTNPGDSYQRFDPSGQYTGTGQFQSVSNLPSWEDIRPLASIAAAAYGGSLLSGSGVGGQLAGAGDAFMPGALDSATGAVLGDATMPGALASFGANPATTSLGALGVGAGDAFLPGALNAATGTTGASSGWLDSAASNALTGAEGFQLTNPVGSLFQPGTIDATGSLLGGSGPLGFGGGVGWLGSGVASTGSGAGTAATTGAAGAGTGLAGETLSKAVLDGTNIFGANSAAGALDIGALASAAPGAAAANAVSNIANGLGYTTPAATTLGGGSPGATPPSTTPAGTPPVPTTAGGSPPVTPSPGSIPGTGLTLDSIGKWISDNKNVLGLGAAAVGALGAGSGGGTPPTPKTPEQVAADQLAINKGIIDQTAPLLHPNSVNPTGSSTWTKGPDGQWTNTQALNQASQGLFDTSTQGLQSLLSGINPNERAPELIKDAGGKYNQQLADAIYARMERQFKPAQDAARAKLESRMAERGFAPGTDGWDKEMNRFEQSIGGQIQDATNQAQITAATQGLNEANFTNTALMNEFTANNNNRSTLAQLLSGARNGTIQGLNTLPMNGSSPALPTTNAASVNSANYDAALNNYNNDTQKQNDLWATLMKYGLNLFGK